MVELNMSNGAEKENERIWQHSVESKLGRMVELLEKIFETLVHPSNLKDSD